MLRKSIKIASSLDMHLKVEGSLGGVLMIIMIDQFKQLSRVQIVGLWFLWFQAAKG